MTKAPFHPLVSDWFENRFGAPTEPQRQGWPRIREGGNVLIAAPTGSGKTLAAFLGAIDSLVRQSQEGQLQETTHIVYVSPLKALANDVKQNLLSPLHEIGELATHRGGTLPALRVHLRTGDTPAHRRRMALKRPPHILVTTPESLFILLTSRSGRELLVDTGTVIVDEIHALAQSKRGSHLALSLERLETLTRHSVQRIGLSATQKPIAEIGRFLAGPDRPVSIVDVGHRRQLDLAVEVPGSDLEAVASHQVWEEIYQRIADLCGQHRTTLVFVNTRRLAERAAHHLAEILGEDQVEAHHGSLARETRLGTEQRLKQGQLKVVVATASLELGIDVGSIDLVCQIGSTRSIALALQRVGRSGHWKGAVPKGRIFATTRDELLECAALVEAIAEGELDRIRIPQCPLDVLAQQVVAWCAGDEWNESDLFGRVRQAWPYASLRRRDFDALIRILSEGISTRKGRRGAYLHRDRVHSKVRGRRGARLAAVTGGGAIPDNANYLVKVEPEGLIVGDLDEDFAVESMRGDIFLLGNTSWRILRIESGAVWVEDAQGAPPNIPFWRGEAPARSDEVSARLSRLRVRIAESRSEEALAWLQKRCGLNRRGAEQADAYIRAGCSALGCVPSRRKIVAERFFDEAGGMQLILHAPLGSRINKAWGLALRKRFCRSFNFELQAASTENGIVISLSDQHSFPLDSVFSFLRSATVADVLTQALLAIPLFGVRWRWTATRALAVRRFSGGRKVPPPLQRMRSDDLLAAVFPEQAACLEHISGDIEIPDHPLVKETMRDCLSDAMDVEGLTNLIRAIEKGSISCIAIDTREPSPFCHEILNANPYAYLDNAPLEERRTRAVQTRRTLLPVDAGELSLLDAQAITEVAEQAWPLLRDAEELHDALLTLGVVTAVELETHGHQLTQLASQRRAFSMRPQADSELTLWVAAERMKLVELAYPEAVWQRSSGDLERVRKAQWGRDRNLDRESATAEILRHRLESSGPLTTPELQALLGLPLDRIDNGLLQLEAEGQILRGSFRTNRSGLEWCDRRLLARIHRLTLSRLRKEIQAVPAPVFMRFLLSWQHVAPRTHLHGESGTAQVLEQLQGLEAPAAAWEKFLLPGRVDGYQPSWLDALCLSGRFAWGRLSSPGHQAGPTEADLPPGRVRPNRLAPLAFFERRKLPFLLGGAGETTERRSLLSHVAAEVLDLLERWGASFFDELVQLSGRLPVEVEQGLWELVTAGQVTADGFAGLRALIDPRQRNSGRRRHKWRRKRQQALASGRWTLLRPRPVLHTAGNSASISGRDAESLAWLMLKRWGILFRDLVAGESLAPPWRELAPLLRRWEAQGKLRGGRFVEGFAGEQFALPEAVDSLRSIRRQPETGQCVRISAADPLNLTGILFPGPRIRSHPENLVTLCDGRLVAEEATPSLSVG